MVGVEGLSVAHAKVQDYLLNIKHPEGWSKAKFFLARGFDLSQPSVLAEALAVQALMGWPGDELITPGSVKHKIVGPVQCPDGSAPDILTVWQVKTGSTSADLVTARPYRLKSAERSAP